MHIDEPAKNNAMAAAKDLNERQIQNAIDILRWLLSAGNTQDQVAKMIKTTQTTVSAILSGKQGVSLSLAERIAEAAGKDIWAIKGPKSVGKRSFAAETAAAFAKANGIQDTIINEALKAVHEKATPEEAYFEIRVAETKQRQRLR